MKFFLEMKKKLQKKDKIKAMQKKMRNNSGFKLFVIIVFKANQVLPLNVSSAVT